MDVSAIEKLKAFMKSNPEYNKYLAGVGTDSNVIYVKNEKGKLATVSLEGLESGRLDLAEFNKEDAVYNYKTLPNGQKQRIVEEPLSLKKEEPEEEIEVMDDFEPAKEIVEPKLERYTLKDLYNAVVVKDIDKIDDILITEYRNPVNGTIDMDKAIDTITNNSVKAAATYIKDEIDYPEKLENFDIKGNIIIKEDPKQNNNKEDIEKKAFMPVKVVLASSQLKGISKYDIKDIENQFKVKVDDRIRTISPVIPEEKKEEIVPEKENVPKLSYTPVKKITTAGFADIFILTVIILVYAAIIINLILKMK